MHHNIVIRTIQPNQVVEALALVHRVFTQDVAPAFNTRGVAEFLHFADEQAMIKRLRVNSFALVALDMDTVVGIIEVRNYDHISLLFVDKHHQKHGIGRTLCRHAIDICKNKKLALDEVTVNASPNAVIAYKQMGFMATENEKMVHGIRFTRMSLNLTHIK